MSDPLSEGLADWADGTIALQKEVERLRSALAEIIELEALQDDGPSASGEIAIRALKEKENP